MKLTAASSFHSRLSRVINSFADIHPPDWLIKVLIVANVVSATKNDPCSDIVESVDESVNLISQIRRQLQVSI